MGPIQSVEELISFLLRRWRLIAFVAVVGAVLSLMVAKSQTSVYEATAVLQIEAPRIQDERATAGSSAAQQLQLIEQRLMVRENLIAVIERNGLFADLPDSMLTTKVNILRQATTIQSVAGVPGGSFGSGPSVSAIIVTVRLGDPVQAADVANDFAQSVLDQSTTAQAERTRETVAFFKAEEQRLGEEMAALDAEITAYKNENLDALPSRMDLRRDELASLRTNLDAVDNSIAILEGERTTLGAAQPVREVARRRIAEIETQISVLQSQRQGLDLQRRALDAVMARAPEVEMALGAFDRRQQQVQDRYAVVSRRLAEAETDQRLQSNEQAERFGLLEPAIVPEYAMGSGKKKIAVMGVAASLGLGLMLAFLREMWHPVIRTSAQMERTLGIRPIVAIPDVPKHRPRRGVRA